MRLALICVGRLKAGPERLLFDRYFERLAQSARGAGLVGVDLREIGESRSRRPDERRAEEAAAILAATPKGGALVLLDEQGPAATSEEWAADIGQERDASRPAYAVASGAGQLTRRFAQWRRVLTSAAWLRSGDGWRTAVSRAMTILTGHPYHRG
jgi:23S rRNA (pseudouridine1915-N3)-methyltransferase